MGGKPLGDGQAQPPGLLTGALPEGSSAQDCTSRPHSVRGIVDQQRRLIVRAVGALVAWGALYLVVAIIGDHLRDLGSHLGLPAVPLTGHWGVQIDSRVLPALAFAVVVIVAAPALAARLPWRWLLVASAAVTAMWAVLLAVCDGWLGVTGPVRSTFEYLAFVPRVRGPGEFVRTFVARVSEYPVSNYPVHVRGHPPGMILLLEAMDRLGLTGAGWAAAVMIGGYAAGVAALLVIVRSVADERAARLAAPFVALAPAAVYVASSADGLYAGVGLVVVALFALATERWDRMGDLLAISAGVLFGVGLHLSYGLALVALPFAGLAVMRRRARPLALAIVGTALVTVSFVATGFWWLDGLHATQGQYRKGVAGRRPYRYFVWADLAVFGVIIGPAAVAALGCVRRAGRAGVGRRWWLVPATGLLLVLIADVSGMAKAEVERIWLFLVPPVVAGTAFLVRRSTSQVARIWLALQVLAGLALQVSLRSAW